MSWNLSFDFLFINLETASRFGVFLNISEIIFGFCLGVRDEQDHYVAILNMELTRTSCKVMILNPFYLQTQESCDYFCFSSGMTNMVQDPLK